MNCIDELGHCLTCGGWYPIKKGASEPANWMNWKRCDCSKPQKPKVIQ